MVYEIKIFDGDGNLKEVVMPKLTIKRTWRKTRRQKMQNIDGKFWESKHQIQKLVERLQKVLDECELPDNLDSPESEEDEIKVNWFSNKIEQLSCELGELGEKMGVGSAVAENLQDKREEERLDRGDHLYKQPEGYKVGQ